MKKISLLLMVILIGLCLCGCQKQYKTYSVGEERKFIDKIYEYIDKDNDYCLIDVRNLDEEYAKGHFFGFINYDIKKGTLEEFKYKIESMYSKDFAIFIIDSDGTYVKSLQEVLKEVGYKKIYIYEGGYYKLSLENNDDFSIVTGKDDCGC